MIRAALTAALLLVLASPLGATEVLDRREDRPGVFPVLAAETLRERKVRLPDQLKGERNLLLVAYEREQQADVDTWLAVLDTFALTAPAFAYYELPTISSGMRWMRLMIDGGMRQGIPDRAQRDRTITLYLDVDWFRTQIGTADHDGIAALLVDREGTIHARWFGRYDDSAGAQLRAALAGP
jgi:hypothetical protein